MQFLKANSLVVSGAETSSPNAIAALDRVFLFFTGTEIPGEDVGISFLITEDGENWASDPSPVASSGLSVMAGTSPSAVLWNGTLYLFYVAGGKGISYTTTSDAGKSWSQAFPAINQPTPAVGTGTSPSVVQFNGALYIFYSTNDNQIWYSKSTDGQNWDPVSQVSSAGMSVLVGTNPSTRVFSGQLFVFFTGSSADGIFYTSTDDGSNWSETQCAGVKTPPTAGIPEGGTSATTAVLGTTLYVAYTADGINLSMITSSDGQSWTSIQTVTNAGAITWGGASAPAFVEFRKTHLLFWNTRGTISVSNPAYYDLPSDGQICLRRAAAGLSLAICLPEDVATQFMQTLANNQSSGGIMQTLQNVSLSSTVESTTVTDGAISITSSGSTYLISTTELVQTAQAFLVLCACGLVMFGAAVLVARLEAQEQGRAILALDPQGAAGRQGHQQNINFNPEL